MFSSLTLLQRLVETQQRKRDLAELLLSPGQHAESEQSLDRLRVSQNLVEEVLELSLIDCITFDHCSSKQALQAYWMCLNSRNCLQDDKRFISKASSSRVSVREEQGTIHHLDDDRPPCKSNLDALCWTNAFFSHPPNPRFEP
jgi:hypothetical protein